MLNFVKLMLTLTTVRHHHLYSHIFVYFIVVTRSSSLGDKNTQNLKTVNKQYKYNDQLIELIAVFVRHSYEEDSVVTFVFWCRTWHANKARSVGRCHQQIVPTVNVWPRGVLNASVGTECCMLQVNYTCSLNYDAHFTYWLQIGNLMVERLQKLNK